MAGNYTEKQRKQLIEMYERSEEAPAEPQKAAEQGTGDDSVELKLSVETYWKCPKCGYKERASENHSTYCPDCSEVVDTYCLGCVYCLTNCRYNHVPETYQNGVSCYEKPAPVRRE